MMNWADEGERRQVRGEDLSLVFLLRVRLIQSIHIRQVIATVTVTLEYTSSRMNAKAIALLAFNAPYCTSVAEEFPSPINEGDHFGHGGTLLLLKS